MDFHSNNNFQFLSGGGEMGQLMRDKDWSKTSLGAVEIWPQSLRTTLSIIIHSKFPMFLFWGPELICFYNDAYRPSLGQDGKHPGILGMPAITAWTEIWDIVKPLMDIVLAGGSTWSEDQLIPIFRNGKIEDVYWTFGYSPVNDESGEPAGVLVICTETTEKLNNLKRLNESRDQLQFAIEATALGTWDYNPITNKLTGNARLKSWFGLAKDDEIDLSMVLNAIVDKDRQRVVDTINIALDYHSGGDYSMEYTITNPLTRKEIILQAKGKARFDENNTAYRFDGTLQDVTAQTLARNKIAESERNMKQMNLQAPVAICILRGPENIFENVNPLMEKLLGRPANEVQGRNIFEAMPELANHGLEKVLADIHRTGDSFIADGQEFELPRGQELKTKYITYIYEPMKTENGTVDGIMVVAIDVTEKKIFQQELEKLVQIRTQELESKNIDLEKMNRELQSFAYISSHDLQEPLRKIQTFSSLMLESEKDHLTDQGKHYFKRMQLAAQRMQMLIDDLLAYSRTGKSESKLVKTDLKQIISEIKNDLQEELDIRNAIIDEKGDCAFPMIPFQFRQLLQNLISNALKFSKPGQSPHITIITKPGKGSDFKNETLKPEAKYIHISISDNGIGFPPEFSEKIFELFQRLHSKDQYMGTGIGLAIVKRIVENHNGIITAKGEIGKGAQFDIYIPEP